MGYYRMSCKLRALFGKSGYGDRHSKRTKPFRFFARSTFLRLLVGAALLTGVSVFSSPVSAQGISFEHHYDRYRAQNEMMMLNIKRAHQLQREQQKEHHKVDKQYRADAAKMLRRKAGRSRRR
jgi:hypothetical protein